MICADCADAADLQKAGFPAAVVFHQNCKGETHCDCQHKPVGTRIQK